MFKRTKPPKHILFIGEKTETRDYIKDIIKESVLDPKEKTPSFTFSVEEPNFDDELHESLLKKTDGTIFLINFAKMDEISKMKEYLWENFVWNELTANIPILIAGYNAEKAIALTASGLRL